MLPAIEMPGAVEGISWVNNISLNISQEDPQINLPTPLWEESSFFGDGHQKLIELRNLKVPLPIFVEEAVSTFSPLRQKTRELAGWDFLSTLEAAYLLLDESLEPYINLEWLYTGRGLMINDIPRLADWLIVIREEYAEKTFWRVYIKTNDQSGLQGKPIKEYPWDFNARYSGNNSAYENGGARMNSVPSGYWLDFTELAAAYGWNRFPAENYWQFSETASRYQYFAFSQGLSLESALLQLYPPEAIKGLTGFANP
jgi:TolB protein